MTEERKGFTHKDINADYNAGNLKTLARTATRVALFVPKLLGKMSEKLIVSPLVKVTTGVTHEQTKQAAVDTVLRRQQEAAKDMEPQIEKTQQEVNKWSQTQYNNGTILDLIKFRMKTKELANQKRTYKRYNAQTPRKILVLTAYVNLMRNNREKHLAELERQAHINQVMNEYQQMLETINRYKTMETEAQQQLATLIPNFELFIQTHTDIIGNASLGQPEQTMTR